MRKDSLPSPVYCGVTRLPAVQEAIKQPHDDAGDLRKLVQLRSRNVVEGCDKLRSHTEAPFKVPASCRTTEGEAGRHHFMPLSKLGKWTVTLYSFQRMRGGRPQGRMKRGKICGSEAWGRPVRKKTAGWTVNSTFSNLSSGLGPSQGVSLSALHFLCVCV